MAYNTIINPEKIAHKEDNANKVTTLSSSSTNTQYPSAKCVYDTITDVELAVAGALAEINTKIGSLEEQLSTI